MKGLIRIKSGLMRRGHLRGTIPVFLILVLCCGVMGTSRRAVAESMTPGTGGPVTGERTLDAGTLWYNGDFDGFGGLSNELGLNSPFNDGRTYDDFNVTGPGWFLTDLFSNNLMTAGLVATMADFEIRSGVSAGNGGILVASGTSAATQTPTGVSFFGQIENEIRVTGLSITLAPGTYWLNIRPHIASGRSFVSTTSGTNAMGTPPGNNANSFFDSQSFNSNFSPTSNINSGFADFSMGVDGQVVPEPSTLLLLGFGLAGLGFLRRREEAA